MSIEVSALEIYCENIRDLLWDNCGTVDPRMLRYVELKYKDHKTHCIG